MARRPGLWDAATPPVGAEHVTIAVSGAHGGTTVDFRELAAEGVIRRRANECDAGIMRFGTDLKANVDAGDANYLGMPDAADAYRAKRASICPRAGRPRDRPRPGMHDQSDTGARPVAAGSQRSSGPSVSVMTTTGCRWTRSTTTANPVINAACRRSRASTRLPPAATRIELYLGVWHDAKYLADQIAIQRSYAAYQAPAAD